MSGSVQQDQIDEGARQRVSAQPSEALARLRALIESSGCQPGSKLPPERVLASQLGVGRPALREAIKALSILDVLESRRGDGTYLKSREPLNARWPAHVDLDQAGFGLLELLEVRKMIEPRAAWLAAARGDERCLQAIEKARRNLEKRDQSWQEVVELDWELHSSIIRAAKNRVLELVNESLTPLMIRSRQITARTTAPDRSRMHRDHAAVVSAILRGQPDQAERAMLDHLQTVGLDLIAEVKL
jgi:GntR family transcriptional regulator, transcriptional repressor for pyruvate dehydrogenase complex